jgi:hypothetical protein
MKMTRIVECSVIVGNILFLVIPWRKTLPSWSSGQLLAYKTFLLTPNFK